MTKFKVTVTSDTVCPWCYVGRKKLQSAITLWNQTHPNSNDTFEVSYQPFQLQPDWPRGPASSRSKKEFYIERFGAERAQQMHVRMKAIGEAVGIDFKFGGNTGNTRDSHRLVQLAKKYGDDAESKTLDGLFAAYFEHEQDITNYDTLKKIAVESGILAEDFQKAIVDSDEGGLEVDKLAGQARRNGVSGVPDYVIQDRYRLEGANDAASFVNAFEQIQARGG